MSTTSVRDWSLRAAALAATLGAGVAQACPVCFAAKDEAERQALFDTTVFLTVLPLLSIGGLIFWVVRRSRQLEAEDSATAQPPQRAATPAEPEREPAAGSLRGATGR